MKLMTRIFMLCCAIVFAATIACAESDKPVVIEEHNGRGPVVDRVRTGLTPDQRTLFDGLVEKIDSLDASPRKDSAIFYSGKVGDGPAWKIVKKVVSESNGSSMSINETQLGAYLMDAKTQNAVGGLPPDAVRVIWDEASRKYAQSAQGKIAFIGDPKTVMQTSVFYRVELPELLSNPSVSSESKAELLKIKQLIDAKPRGGR